MFNLHNQNLQKILGALSESAKILGAKFFKSLRGYFYALLTHCKFSKKLYYYYIIYLFFFFGFNRGLLHILAI